ncbi:hypothetical protein HZC09_00810 [Candidatus Micrarchaeota archaeon]|nr:hypothetical protein [Candidatus Micrarchaeota archaeon]
MKESGLPVLVAEAIRNYHGRTEIDEKQKADIISLLSSYKNPEDLKDAIKVIAEHGIPGLKALIHLPRKQGEKIKPSKILELFNVGIDAKIRGDTVHSLAHSRWEREGTPLDEVIADLRNSKK